MKRIIIRHASTGIKRTERAEHGPQGPSIDELGKQQSRQLKQALIEAGVSIETEPVAISELIRTRETAELAGLRQLNVNPLLNEVNTGLPHEEFLKLFTAEKVAPEVLRRARMVLDNPPPERIWVTHGLLIIGLREVLGIKGDPFNPPNAEIIELDI